MRRTENKMQDVIIRKITPEDVDRVMEIATQQWLQIYDQYRKVIGDELFERFYKGAINNLRNNIYDRTQRPDYCFVAVIDGVVCGFASYRVEETALGKNGVVGYNGVDNAYKGRGIAGKLYNKLFDEMRAAGCDAAKVHTGLDDGHAPARRAYQKAGFEVGLPSIDYFKKL